MDFCPRCGAGVLDGMKRCPDCKRPVSTARKSGMAEEMPAAEEKKNAGVFDGDAPKEKRRSIVIKKDIVSFKKLLRVIIALTVIVSAIFSSLTDKEEADIAEAPDYSPAISTAEEQYFFDCTAPGESVYADIVSIFPAYKIYEEEDVYTHFACECVSASGDILWLYITISDYAAFFDSEAWDSIYSDYADEISFPARTIHGFTRYADDLIEDFSKDIGSEMLMEFVSAE